MLKYNPRRGKNQNSDWWLVVEVDPEITRYYRWWAKTSLGILLHAPSWDAHVSVVRGEEPKNRLAWGKHDNQIIAFNVKPDVRQTGDTTGWDRPDNYWFVDIFSAELSAIKQELGFAPKEKYHITIGRTY